MKGTGDGEEKSLGWYSREKESEGMVERGKGTVCG
jgi:hypothetical protein